MMDLKNAAVIGGSALLTGGVILAVYEVGTYIKEKRSLDKAKEQIADIDKKVKETINKVNCKVEEKK